MSAVLAILFIVALVYATGYFTGRDKSADEIEVLHIHVASLEAAQRISLRAWQTAREMEAAAGNVPAATPALPLRGSYRPPGTGV